MFDSHEVKVTITKLRYKLIEDEVRNVKEKKYGGKVHKR